MLTFLIAVFVILFGIGLVIATAASPLIATCAITAVAVKKASARPRS